MNARAQADRVRALPRELLAVTNHIHEGRIFRAEEIARAFLQRNPTHVEGMRLLADIGSRLGVQEDADFLLESAVGLDPDNIQLRLDYIQVLRKRQKFSEALEQAKTLMAGSLDRSMHARVVDDSSCVLATKTYEFVGASCLIDRSRQSCLLTYCVMGINSLLIDSLFCYM